jgi:preprotein translocase subunit SecG
MVVGVVMLVLVQVGRGEEAGGVDDTRNPGNASGDCTPLATPAIV